MLLDTASVRALYSAPAGLDDCFTVAEMASVSSRVDPVPSLSARLAAKLSVLAILEAHAAEHVDARSHGGPVVEFGRPSPERAALLASIEVLVSPAGVPQLALDHIVHPSRPKGWVSLSHDAGLGAALVVLHHTARSDQAIA